MRQTASVPALVHHLRGLPVDPELLREEIGDLVREVPLHVDLVLARRSFGHGRSARELLPEGLGALGDLHLRVVLEARDVGDGLLLVPRGSRDGHALRLLLLLLLPVLLPLLLPLPILLAHLALAHTPRVLAIAPARQPSLAVRLQLLPKRRRLPLRRLRVRLQLTLALLLRAFELLQRRALKVLQRPEVRLLPRGGVVRRVELVALEPDVGGRVPAAAVVAAHVVRPVAAVHRER
mmetsp:Transcript_415/g.1783  ORF Transcript_415/g.1783 Transcript_415/m.1783 type:complete len:236 (+) Transcript_415:1371-2078(+)